MERRYKVFTICLILLLGGGLLLSLPPQRAAAQKEGKEGNAQISDSALRQIESLIQEKESRTPTQQKIDSQLLYAMKQARGEALTSEVNSLEVNVNADEQGLVAVDIKARVSEGLLKTIGHLGGQIIFQSAAFNSITARVPLQSLEKIAGLEDVKFISPADRAYTHKGGGSTPSGGTAPPTPAGGASAPPAKGNPSLQRGLPANFAARAARVRAQVTNALAHKALKASTATVLTGPVDSEGDTTHRAAEARSFFGVSGAGVKIGVLSDGVDSLASQQAAGELPAVTVLPGQAGSGDEGTAMLEIVNDLAPGAQLFFATAFTSQASFAQNILDLRTAGCDIIVDDVGYFREAVFQDDNVARSVNTVTAAGALYFSSAGNEGNKDDNESGVWEGDFNDSGSGTVGTVTIAGGTIHDFGAGNKSDQLTASNGGAPIGLFWSDPLGASGNDYDLYILDAGLTTIVNAATNVQNGDDDPVELSTISPASGRRMVIFKKTGAAVRALHLNTFRGLLAINTVGQTHGHSSAAAAYSVAATPAAAPFGPPPNPVGPFPGPFNSSNMSELFTSDGPRRIFYNPDSTPITPGNVLFGTNGGVVRQKPDITAADGTSSAVPGFNPFYGTSAAAPHAAAIAGLLKSSNVNPTPAQIRTALTSSAIDIEAAGVDRDTGFGIVMAFQALQALGAVPVPVLNAAGSTLVNESCPPTNGAIDPGETVTVRLNVSNTGGAPTSNLVGTLQPNANVLAPSAPQNYGAIPVGSTVGRDFTFTVNGNCGDTITLTLQLQDGATNFGTVTFTRQLGVAVVTGVFSENFDGVTPPALPAGWTTTATGVEVPWVTSTTNPSSAPNDAFAPDVANVGNTELVTPSFAVPASGAQLTFRNLYNMENTFDGMVLEISVNGGAFADITAGGNAFIAGGYSGTISTLFSSPIAGRPAWTGLSGGTTAAPTYITSTINLPAAASGQNVRLKWRAATDSSVIAAGAAGVRVDTVSVSSTSFTCNTACAGAPRISTSTALSCSGSQTVATITITNSGTGTANNVVLTTATLGGISGTPLPQTVGTLAPGASSVKTVTFSGAPSGMTTLVVGGTFTGGSYSSSRKVTAPACNVTLLTPAVPYLPSLPALLAAVPASNSALTGR